MRFSRLCLFCCALCSSLLFAQVVQPPPVLELAARRAKVFEAIRDGVAVLPGAQKVSGYVEFRQSNDFWYLTGLEVPDSWLFLDGKSKKAALLIPQKGYDEAWVGPFYASIDEVKAQTGIDDVRIFSKRKALELLHDLTSADRPIYLPNDPEEVGVTIADSAGPAYKERAAHPWERFKMRELGIREAFAEIYPKQKLEKLSGIIRTQRLKKQPSEIDCLRKASSASARAMIATIKAARPGRFEYELAAVNEFEGKVLGCQGPSYHPIVGSGPNSCILHYSKKNRRLEDGDMVCCDAASTFSYYTSDITRSFPANGKFTDEQRRVYSAVLEAQEACIKETKPGVPLMRLQRLAVEILKKHDLNKYFIHGLSHHVGMAVHDPSSMGALEVGHVFTIEPGAYLTKEAIGVRIEDVILVTEDGCEVLTKECPKSIEAIEALMAK